MRAETDHIKTYLALKPDVASLVLFNTFYGLTDGPWLHGKWEKGEMVPLRLNTWSQVRCQDIRIDRMGLQVVA